MFPQHTNEEAH